MSTTVHAFDPDDALGLLDATGVAERIRRGEISAAEAQAAAVSRLQRVNPALNALVLPTFDNPAQRPAQTGPGPFAGVPTVIKDNVDILGLPTRYGSRAVPGHPARQDSEFVQQYLATGLVCLGKSTLPEFGFSASTEFAGQAPTRNPWHTDYSSGASSGGSAALVASGAVPIAHANDGGGSIRIPAACCGLVGLKPTRGRLVINTAQKSLPINIICDGVVTRSVRDSANFYAGAEQLWRNPALPPIGRVQGPQARRLRIGLALDSINGTRTDEPTRAAVCQAAQRLAGAGHHVEEIALPVKPAFADDFALYWGFLAFMVDKLGHRIIQPGFDARQLENLSRGLSRHFQRQAWRAPAMLYRLRRSQREYADFMRAYDVVLTPVLAHTTPPLGYLSAEQPFEDLFAKLQRYVCFTPLNNVTGAPALSLPAGRSPAGLPIGLHLTARHGDEATLLGLAFELEQLQPFPLLASAG